jgi:AbrB family looped-hinge helix DNA binding protein
MNAQTRMSAKGQVVIPKSVRERLRWDQGADLEVIETAEGVLLRSRRPERERLTIEEFRRRMPKYEGPPASLEDMNQAIDRAMAERWTRKERDSR